MRSPLTRREVEQRLAVSLTGDRGVRRNVRITIDESGTTTSVRLSNRSMGLAIWLEDKTGEDAMAIIERVGNGR